MLLKDIQNGKLLKNSTKNTQINQGLESRNGIEESRAKKVGSNQRYQNNE